MSNGPWQGSFNLTFIPERKNLVKILGLCQKGTLGKLTDKEISFETGIPTGKSSGKVQPTIKYAQAMGLMREENPKDFRLLPFGEAVLEQDYGMDYPITQWVAHAFLCDQRNGAEAWNKTFSDWMPGTSRTLQYLANQAGEPEKVYTPTIRMYSNPLSFASAQIVTEDTEYRRNAAPLASENMFGYGAVFAQCLHEYFPGAMQVALDEFDKTSQYAMRFGWDSQQLQSLMSELSAMGIVKVHAFVSPVVVQLLVSEDSLWASLYDNFI